MPNFAYTSGRPAGNLSPAAQRADLQTNNDNNALIWDVDHYGFNDNNGGLHQKATFVDQTSSPPAGVAGSDILYSKMANSVLELFMQRATGSAVQITGNAVTTGSEINIVTPWGITLKLGTATASSSGVGVSFATAFPTSAIGVILGVIHTGSALSTSTSGLSTTGFTAWLQSGPGTQSVYYFAWGT